MRNFPPLAMSPGMRSPVSVPSDGIPLGGAGDSFRRLALTDRRSAVKQLHRKFLTGPISRQ